ncbi:MAG: hypothetical protein ACYSSO_04660 [Planctomycetota bacterium]|jgi:prepilin-type processing-associated H-X9-DG protein
MKTKRDLIVIFGCIVFLLATLGAVGDSGRRRAKEIVCLSNLRQWGAAFMMFAEDHGGYFMGGRSDPGGNNWFQVLEPYYGDRNLLLCPMADDPSLNPWEGFGNFGTWGPNWYPGGFYGSYGVNEWICNPQSSIWGGSSEKYWRTPNVAGTDKIPLLLDAWWDQGWAEAFDWIPSYPGEFEGVGGDDMAHFCVIRHDGAVNGIFLDGSASRIELQCLWWLKWNRLSDMEDAPTYEDYPDWLKELPECNLELE